MKYNIVAEKFLCIACLLEIAIKENSDLDVNQYQIAEYFGLSVPIGYKTIIDNQRETNDIYKLGIVLDAEKLNEYFDSLRVGLRAEYYEGLRFNEEFFPERLRSLFQQGGTLIITVDYGELVFKKEARELGHALIITNIIDEEVELFNPGPDDAGLMRVSSLRLYDSMRARRGGVFRVYKADGEEII